MNKKFILGLLTTILISSYAAVSAYNSDELNKRLRSCTPSKDFDAGGSVLYQISGLTGSTCIYRIDYSDASNKPDLICKVPFSRMHEMTSANPVVVRKLRNQYCVMSIKSFKKAKSVYY